MVVFSFQRIFTDISSFHSYRDPKREEEQISLYSCYRPKQQQANKPNAGCLQCTQGQVPSHSSSLATTWAVVVMAWHLICKGHNNIPFSYMFITDEKETERRKERENLSTSSWIKLKQLEISWIKFTRSPVLDTAVLFTNTAILNCVLSYFLNFFHSFICAWSHAESSAVSHEFSVEACKLLVAIHGI